MWLLTRSLVSHPPPLPLTAICRRLLSSSPSPPPPDPFSESSTASSSRAQMVPFSITLQGAHDALRKVTFSPKQNQTKIKPDFIETRNQTPIETCILSNVTI
jgi:hypothetical protein